MSDFDPDGPGGNAGLFGIDSDPRDSRILVLSVPWEATASYGRGTRHAPAAILQASQQVDLEDLEYGATWSAGIAMVEALPGLGALADAVEADALEVISSGGQRPDLAARVDAVAERLNVAVQERALRAYAAGQVPIVLGGDHSAPHGLHRAAAARYPGVGILQIDAHADLRPGFLGFRNSHASAMHNALAHGVARVVGVGWRDLGQAEVARARAEPDRIAPFPDHRLAEALADGRPWTDLVDLIIDALPPVVHVSMDIDGLEPALCPGTGTPVPGGLSFRQLQILLRRLSQRRAVVSADLCEVGARPGAATTPAEEWDANIGARVLYKLAGCAVRSPATPPPWRVPGPGLGF